MTRIPQPPDPLPPDPAGDESLRRAIVRAVARHEQRLMGLLTLSRDLSVRDSPESFASRALASLMTHVDTERGALWLRVGAAESDLRLVASKGLDSGAMAACASAMLEWCHRPDAERRPTAALDTRVEGLADGARAVLVVAGLRTLGDLATSSGSLGVVALGAPREGGALTSFDQHALRTALRMLAVAHENASLFREVEGRTIELEQANADLREMDRLRSEFLANVNHELRTPIAVVSGAASCLRHLTPPDDEVARFIEMIESQTTRLAETVQRLLDFGSLSGTHRTIEREPMDLDGSVLAAMHRHRAAVESGGRHIEHRAAEHPVVADSDAVHVAHILDQLISNAVKFTPSGTTIRLEAAHEIDGDLEWACVRVADDGPGIDPRLQEQVFRPFVQADGSTTRRVGGLGLGLALARATAERLSGGLEVHSEPGRGATFTLRLPTPRPDAGSADKAEAA